MIHNGDGAPLLIGAQERSKKESVAPTVLLLLLLPPLPLRSL
jgi:hypothetical protein